MFVPDRRCWPEEAMLTIDLPQASWLLSSCKEGNCILMNSQVRQGVIAATGLRKA